MGSNNVLAMVHSALQGELRSKLTATGSQVLGKCGFDNESLNFDVSHQ